MIFSVRAVEVRLVEGAVMAAAVKAGIACFAAWHLVDLIGKEGLIFTGKGFNFQRFRVLVIACGTRMAAYARRKAGLWSFTGLHSEANNSVGHNRERPIEPK